jgi:hypothetical protein
VFGVSSSEYLGYAEANREEWVKKGEELVQVYLERFKLRESAGSGDFRSSNFPSFGGLRIDETMGSFSDSAVEPQFRKADASVVGLSIDDEGSKIFEIEV